MEYVFTPHYTRKTQHITFDAVKNCILGHIQKTNANGTDMAQVLRAMDYLKSEVGNEPQRRNIDITSKMSEDGKLSAQVAQDGYDL